MPAEECPTGWRCGLEGRCHALDAGAAYACRSTADCEGPWRCGLEKVCHPLHAGAAYQCETTADCEGPWRCGLEKVCHPLDAGAPYLCNGDDAYCEAQWRCGPLDVCIDSTRDGLELPSGGFLTVQPRLLFPSVPGATGEIGASVEAELTLENDAGCKVLFPGRSVTWHRDGMLVKRMEFPNGTPDLPGGIDGGTQACDDVGTFPARRAAEIQTPLTGVISLSDTLTETVALLDDGRLCRFAVDATFTGAAPLSCRSPFTAPFPTRLKSISEGSSYLAWRDDRLWWLDSFAATAEGPFVTPDGGVLDTLAVETGSRGVGMLAITADQLFLARLFMGVFESPDGGVGRWGEQSLDGYRTVGGGAGRSLTQWRGTVLMALGTEVIIAEQNPVGFFDVFDFGGGAPKWTSPTYSNDLLETCERDGTFGGLTRASEPTVAAFKVGTITGAFSRCRPTAGPLVGRHQGVTLSIRDQGPPVNRREFSNVRDTDTSPPVWFFAAPTRAGLGNPGSTVWGDDLGHLWEMADNTVAIDALLPDRPLDFVGGDSTLIAIGNAPVDWVEEKAGVGNDVIQRSSWTVQPDGGWESGFRISSFGAVGAVRGVPGITILQIPPTVFTRTVIVGDIGRNLILGATGDLTTVLPPLDTTLLERGGKRQVVWRSFDTVWLSDLDERTDAGIFSDLSLYPSPVRRLTPLVNQAITSMAWGPEQADGGHFLDGYLIAGPRLFSFSALNPRVWRSDEVVVGLDEPVEVFFDRGRARAALRDGTLWSLPSRVRLAPPFAAADGLAVGFGLACQQLLALSEQKLFRLQWNAGEQTGTWTPVALPAAVASTSKLSGAPFAKSRLHSIDRDVLLVHDNGVAWRIQFGGCP